MNKRRPIKNKLLKMFLAVSIASLIFASIAGIISMLKVHENDKNVLLSQVKENIYEALILNSELASSELRKYSGYAEDFSRYIHDLFVYSQDTSPLDSESSESESYSANGQVYRLSVIYADENVSPDAVHDEVMLMKNIGRLWRNIVTDEKDKIAFTCIASKNGFLLVFTSNDSDGQKYYNYFNSSWYRRASEKGHIFFNHKNTPAFTDIYQNVFNKENIVTCAAPFYDADNNFAGVVGIDVMTGDIHDVIISRELKENGTAFLIDGSGRIIGGHEELDDETMNMIRSGRRGSFTQNGMYYAYSPIEFTDWKLCIQVSEREMLKPIRLVSENFVFVLALFFMAFTVIIIMALIAARKFSEKFTKPIISLSNDVKTIAEWNLDHRAEVHDNDEIGDLALNVNDMAVSLKEYMTDFGRVMGEKEQIRAELNVATKIQADMLPREFPKNNKFELFASMTPAKEVGGDFYDFFMIDDDHLALVIADVSDKGVPAALFMVISKTLIRNRALMGGRPSEILSDVNNQLCEGNDAMFFVTVWLGILELSTGHVTASNAGHELPAVMQNGESFKLMNEENHDPAMAVIPDIEFGDNEFTLEPGSMIYLYTDGVAEAMNHDNELYGTDRMLDVLNLHTEDSSEAVLYAMKNDIDAFVKGVSQSDDITMICMKYFGTGD